MRKFSPIPLLLLLAFAFNSMRVQAQTTIRYQEQIRGGATLIGNSWMYATDANCFPIAIFADVDGDATTTNSSSADLILPAGSIIEKAYLSIERGEYYSAQPLTSVKLKVPGAATYQTLTPASPSFLVNRSGGSDGYYYEQSIFDITSLMPVNGYVSGATGGVAGRYFLADPLPSLDTDNWGPMGGWSIIIVYRNNASKLRSITVADNWQHFVSGITVNTDIAGVRVPASGIVNAVVGMTGTYGDRVDCQSNTLDYTDILRFGQTTGILTNLADPMTGVINNALNSSIAMAAQNNVSADGGPAMSGNVTTRNPVSAGHIYGPAEAWDYDADIFNATGILPASATPLNVRLQQTSNGSDVLLSGSYFISVDLGIAVLSKSVSPASITDGGIATYTFTIDNTATGAVNQSGLSFTDALPAGLRIAATPNVVITGGSGGTVTAPAGGSAISLSGFNLNAGQTATITVNVTNVPGQINADCASNPAAFTNNGDNITALNDNLANGVGNVCLLVTASLPVNFSAIEATIFSNLLSVNWTTYSETDNNHFEIEVSADGKNFTRIGEVKTKATNGNSDLPLSYTFAGDLNSVPVLGGIGLLLLVSGTIGFSYRKKKVFTLLVIAGIAAGIAACNKNNKEVIGGEGKLFLRIAQVDTDGTKKYSKTVLVNRK